MMTRPASQVTRSQAPGWGLVQPVDGLGEHLHCRDVAGVSVGLLPVRVIGKDCCYKQQQEELGFHHFLRIFLFVQSFQYLRENENGTEQKSYSERRGVDQ